MSKMQLPLVISTFAGCGGSSLGYQMAGFKELLAIDFDKNAVETFALNFPDVPVWQRDIKEVTGKEILDFCKIKKGELDVLDGSPPCQGFSTAGKRNVSDSRNDLFKEYSRLLKELQPKVFVMENVSGMMKGKMKGMFLEILAELKSCGYNVKCKLMNAMWYDVPQSRERLIFIGVRKDFKTEISFPKAKDKFITVKEALKNVTAKTFMKQTKFSKDLCLTMKEGTNGFLKHDSKTAFNYVKVSRNKPSPTILKSVKYCGIGMYHFQENRELSVEELKVLCSYPVSFSLSGKVSEQINCLGNSVPPNLMKAIASHIKAEILSHETAV